MRFTRRTASFIVRGAATIGALALAGCESAQPVQQVPEVNGEITNTLRAEVTPMRTARENLRTYEVCLQDTRSTIGLLLELRSDDPFLIKGLGIRSPADWDAFCDRRRWEWPQFTVRVRAVRDKTGNWPWQIVSWTKA
jgi:outer membrane murein-binding lipoprotein Lpp